MQHIETKYHGPSNVRGSRIIATNPDALRKCVLSLDHSLSQDENHKLAARALAAKQWPNGTTYNTMVGYNVAPGQWMWFFADDPSRQTLEIGK